MPSRALSRSSFRTAGFIGLFLAFLSLQVGAQTPVITSQTNPLGTVGAAFAYQLTATEFPTNFTAVNLPPGLVMSNGTAVTNGSTVTWSNTNGWIIGLPQSPGVLNIPVLARNSNGAGSNTLALTVNPPPAPLIASATTIFGMEGEFLRYQFRSVPNQSNVPTIFGASMPAALTNNGLALVTSTATNQSYPFVTVTNYEIRGTPLLNGSFTFPITATNNIGGTPQTVTNDLTFIIVPSNSPVIVSVPDNVLTNTSVIPPQVISNVVNGIVGVPFSFDVVAIRNPQFFEASTNGGISWIRNGALVNGLAFTNVTNGSSVIGRILGTPGVIATNRIDLRAFNETTNATSFVNIVVQPPQPTVILTQPLGEANYVAGSSFYLNAQAFDSFTGGDSIIPGTVGFQEIIGGQTNAVTGIVRQFGDTYGVEYFPSVPPNIAYPPTTTFSVQAFGRNNQGVLAFSGRLLMAPQTPQAAFPTVSMLPLYPGPKIQAGGAVTLRAKALPTGRPVQRVEFYVNKVFVGATTTPIDAVTGEYQVPWTTPTEPGAFNITARAISENIPRGSFDSPFAPPYYASVITRVPVVLNTITGNLPSVAITTPQAGGRLVLNAPATFSAEAIATDGAIDSVQFYANGRPVGTADTVAPFSVQFTPTSYGTYELFAIAKSSAGLENISPTVTVTVPRGNPPSVTLTSQPDLADQTATATATVVSNQVTGLTLVSGGFGYSAAPTVSFTNSPGIGASATAIISPQGIVTGFTNIVGGSGYTVAPAVRLEAPRNLTVRTGSELRFLANPVDGDNQVRQVQFFINGVAAPGANPVTQAPFSYTLNATNPGRYTVVARATDEAGNEVDSNPIEFNAVSQVAPTSLSVDIQAPAPGVKFIPGTTFTALATASSTINAPIANITFYLNDVLQGTPVTTDPYNRQISLGGPGNYILRAVATDIYGNVALKEVTVVCEAPAPGQLAPIISMTHPVPGGAGDTANDFSVTSELFLNAQVSLPTSVTTDIKDVIFFANGKPVEGSKSEYGNFYSVRWRPEKEGQYNITAQVTDSRGLTAVSEALFFSIDPQVRPLPTVEVLDLPSDATTVGSTVYIRARTKRNSPTTVSRLDFYANGVLLGAAVPADSGPSDADVITVFEWTPDRRSTKTAPPNDATPFQISARAMQVLGEPGDNSVISNQKPLIVRPASGNLPVVNLRTQPIAESLYVYGSQLFLNATVSGTNGVASNGMTFYLGGIPATGANSLQFFNGQPVYSTLVNVPGSSATQVDALLFATAQDTNGAVGSSFATTLGFVRPLNLLPEVDMLPVNSLGDLSAGSVVRLGAAALFPQTANRDARVEFYVNNAFVGQGTLSTNALPGGRALYELDYVIPDIDSPTGEVINFEFRARAVALNFETNTGNDNSRRFFGSVASAPEVVPVYFVPSVSSGNPNEQFLVTYFPKLFFRKPTYQEYQYYLAMLEGGASQSEVIVAMAQSKAFNDVQGVLFGYYLRMGMQPASYTQVVNYVRTMTNVLGIVPLSSNMSIGSDLDGINLPPSPYGATLGQANVAASLINANTNKWTNGLVPAAMSDSEFTQWMRRSFNSPYLPQAMPPDAWVYAIGNPGTIQTNIVASFPNPNSPAVVRYGHAYSFISAFYSVFPRENMEAEFVPILDDFPPYMQSVAVNYLLSPTNATNSWRTNLGPLSASNITPLLAPVVSNTGTVVLPLNTNYSLQVVGQNFVSNTTKFGAVNLPAGLTINANSGLISGQPTNALVYTSSIVASNGPAAVGSNSIVFDVLPAAPVLSGQTLRVVVGEPFTTTVNVLNTPSGFTISPAPPWLAVDSNGVMTVQATNPSTNAFTVSAFNRGGTNTNSLVIEAESALASYLRRYPTLVGADRLPSSDADLDGHTLAKEFAFGMNPTVRDAVGVEITASGGEVHISWNRRKTTDSVVRYSVKSTASIGGATISWTNQTPVPTPQLIQPIDDNYERVRVSVPISGLSRFFRVEAELQPGAY